jgi:hypothetical protein
MNLITTSSGRETTISERNSSHRSRQIKSLASLLIVSIVFILYTGRMFRLISRYAVNIFFSDQWDFNNGTLFYKHTLWQIFTWQHGPHRQGLGGLFEKMVDPLSGWNSRTESFVVGGVIVVAALSAMWLRRRLFGNFSLFDIVIPAIVFIPGQWATWFSVANFAHGPFPLLLILLYCLAWSSNTPAVKYSLVLFINLLTIYTGFGLFVGVLTPILLVLDYWASTPGSRLSKTYLATVLLASVASLGSFFIDYKIRPTADCFSFQPQSPISYLKFVALMFANFFGIGHLPLPARLLGTMIMAVLVAVVVTLIWWLLEQQRPNVEPRDRNRVLIIVCLTAYTLLFCINTAYGRLCLGLHAALQSRYVIYLEPAILGLYFFLVGLRHTVARNLLLSGFLIAVVAASLHRDRIAMGVSRDIKQTWKTCYLQTENITECDKVAGFPIYSPSPQQIQRSHLQQKLEYLKKTRQNLYLDQ